MIRFFLNYFLLLVLIAVSVSSCKKDDFLTDSSAKVNFSQNLILFDTVFVSTGSATQIFTVRNNNDKPVKISSIQLATGSNSYFRLNVNGLPGKSFTNVEIGANDSIYVFVEVTIPDPGNPNTPFIIADSILFNLNGNYQQVNLVAWGQRAYFHHAASNTGSLFFLPCNETWTNDLPHVIYGYALVDSGCTLTIEHGTNIYSHSSSGLIVLSSGTLKVNGTLQEPVVFQGDRLGETFKDIPGQWDRVWLSNITHSRLVNGTSEIGPGTVNSSINYAIIKNGNIGLQVDTSFSPGATTVRLDNTIIKNMSGVALLAQGATVRSNNCVFANSGQYLTALLYGGNYHFLHCTFANYWSQGNRTTPSIVINNYFGSSVRPIDTAYFGNCIVYGNIDGEIGVDSVYSNNPGLFNYQFDHCIVKVSADFSTNSGHFKSILQGTDPLFDDVANNNYKLGTTSIAIDAGLQSITDLSPVLSLDLKGDARPQGIGPDLGAYEKR